MNISAPFIHRPVATTLLSLGLALAGAIAYFLLPIAPLPHSPRQAAGRAARAAVGVETAK